MRVINECNIKEFSDYLNNSEMSKATQEKYHRDVLCFYRFVNGRFIDKSICIEYKEFLEKEYAVSSANSMIASLNTFFKFMEWFDFCMKQFKIQKRVFCSEDSELTRNEYQRLVKTAQTKKNERLNLVLQTICGTGIRVS